MTKSDVAIWFCKVLALGGMLAAIFNVTSGLLGFALFGANGFWVGLPALGFYFFVWLFARGIGIELAAEGEHGEPIASAAELGTLLLRCVGLSLFLSGALLFGSLFFGLVFQYFSTRGVPFYLRFMWPNLINGFLQATFGFILAFGPRLRSALRNN